MPVYFYSYSYLIYSYCADDTTPPRPPTPKRTQLTQPSPDTQRTTPPTDVAQTPAPPVEQVVPPQTPQHGTPPTHEEMVVPPQTPTPTPAQPNIPVEGGVDEIEANKEGT